MKKIWLIRAYIFIIIVVFLSLYIFSRFFLSERGSESTIVDNQSLYEDQVEIKELYITVLDSKSNDDYTFEELIEGNGEKENGKDIKLDIIIQEAVDGEICETCFGYLEGETNATIEQRGQSARLADYKSFKIKLDDKIWGMDELNLNKHYFDLSRIRNKFAFDLLKDIPNITSLRTSFTRVYIKDLSDGEVSGFKDYGLFTNVEDVDEDYFESRYLPDGSLYKVEFFEFNNYYDELKKTNNIIQQNVDLDKYFESKGVDDQGKLLTMIDKVNNQTISINQTIDNYFNRENYLTWLAFNMIVDNVDISSRNYYLYSPEKEETWYFIPWDYDGTMDSNEDRSKWQYGIHLYMNNILHARFLEDPENQQALIDKVYEIQALIGDGRLNALVDSYYNLLTPEIYGNIEEKIIADKVDFVEYDFRNFYKETLYAFPDQIDENILIFEESLQDPTPFFIGEVTELGSRYRLNWTPSTSLKGRRITYDVQICEDITCENILFSKKVSDEEVIFSLQEGVYFASVISFDSEGNEQYAFDQIREDSKNYYHIKKIQVGR